MASNGPRVLVADDQADILEALKLLLKGEGFEVETAASPRAVLSAIEARDFDALLVDMNYTRDTTSGAEGLDLLSRLQGVDGAPPVVVMTAWGSIDGAVEAMRRGARDYVEKPWDNRRLLATLRTQVELGRALRKSQRLESENRTLRRDGFPDLIAESEAMRPVLRLMERVGPSDANVLVLGEHGTGKEVVARWLHASSKRAERPMIAVNLGGIPDALFESELFGHVRGAFTDAKTDRIGRFELAEGGTLFLDEIANLPLPQQAKLLRVLETGEFERVGTSRARRADVRLIAATNADIQSEVKAGRFREDLLFRLNTVEIRLPALRERRQDIPLLAAHFLRRYGMRYRPSAKEGFTPDAVELLLRHSWPGNVRELDHAVERAVLLAEGPLVQARDFGLAGGGDGAALDQMSLEEVERVLIQKALTRAAGNVSEAATFLGLSRSALYRRLKRHGL
jgi:DNA-binding NtrC family response regulator